MAENMKDMSGRTGQRGQIELWDKMWPGFHTKEEVTAYLQSSREIWQKFCLLPEKFREELIGYCMGKNGLAITYDSVFKKVFNPDIHRERVESLLSALLKKTVRIKEVLPLEGVPLTEKGSFVIFDMLVQLDDGSYADLEIEDLLDGGISGEGGEVQKKQGEDKTDQAQGGQYVHGRWMQFDTGIMKENRGLHEDVFICLDLFGKNVHNISKDSPQIDVWLTFLSATDVEVITKLAMEFPDFLDIYREIAKFVGKREELMMMLSEELYIMDRNTEREMRQDMEMENKKLMDKNMKLKHENMELMGENTELKDKNTELKDKNTELKDKNTELKDKNTELKDKNTELKDKNTELKDENTELKKQIAELQAQIAEKM